MFGISFGKLIVLGVAIGAVWYGFKWVSRLQSGEANRERVDSERGGFERGRSERGARPAGKRSFSERIWRSMRNKSGGDAAGAPVIEDTERCPTCGVFVSVEVSSNCGKQSCPY